MTRGCLALLGAAVSVGGAIAVWIGIVHDSRYFIGDVSQMQTIEVGDALAVPGPYLHFPDGDMYLLYENLHSVPWLFAWRAQGPGGGLADPVSVNWRGQLRALRPGVADVYARPRLGHGFATTRYQVFPRIDTVTLVASPSTASVGDTIDVRYVIRQADGEILSSHGIVYLPLVHFAGDPTALVAMNSAPADHVRYLARHTGSIVFTVNVGRHVAAARVTIVPRTAR